MNLSTLSHRAEWLDVEEWRGPDGHTLLSWKVNFGAGGASRLCVRSREGYEQVLEGVQLEIVEPERVVFRAGAPVEDLPERQQTFTFRRA